MDAAVKNKGQANPSARTRRKGQVDVRLVHLVTGFANVKGNKIEPVPGTLETIRNRIFCLKDPNNSGKSGFMTLKSNTKGVVNRLKPGDSLEVSTFSIRNAGKEKYQMYMPPAEVLAISWLAGDNNWQDDLHDFFKKFDQGVALNVIPITKSLFKPPMDPAQIAAMPADDELSKSAKDDAQNYYDWYQSFNEKEEHVGIFFAKSRAALLIFNDTDIKNSSITVIHPEGESKGKYELEVQSGKDFTYAILAGTPEELPDGMYKISVAVKNPGKKWNRNFDTSPTYTITEMLRFNLTGLCYEFDIVNCDPVTLEDAMLKQFPTTLNHLVTYLRDEQHKIDTLSPTAAPSDKNRQRVGKQDFEVKNTGLRQIAKDMHWYYSKAKMINGWISADTGHREAKIVTTIAAALGKGSPDMQLAAQSLKVIYSTYNVINDWADHLKKVKNLNVASEKLTTIKQYLDQFGGSHFQKTRMWNYISDTFGSDDPKQRATKLKILRAESYKDPVKAKELIKSLPEKGIQSGNRVKRLAKQAGKKLKVIDRAISAIEICDYAVTAYEKNEQFKTDLAEYKRMFTEYTELFKGGTCKEAMLNLERFRSIAVGTVMEYDEAVRKGAQAAFDLAIGIMAIPVTPLAIVAGLYLVVEATISLADDLAMVLDKALLKGVYDEWKQKNKLLGDIFNGSFANMSLMPEPKEILQEHRSGTIQHTIKVNKKGKKQDIKLNIGENYLRLQYCLRAEALNGLLGLIIRATYSAKENSAAGFKKAMDDYRITDYINTFILDNNWIYDLAVTARTTLDTWWLFNMSEYDPKVVADPDTVSTRGSIKLFFNTLFDDENEERAKLPYVKFNDHFPIHKYSSDDLYDFAQNITPVDNISNTKEWIDKTYVYWRKYKKDQKPHEGWKLINEKGVDDVKKLEKRSPFDEIRIVIVLKDDTADKQLPDGIHPISLQVVRTDGMNLDGPVYKSFVRKLKKEELITSLKHEAPLVGRRGVVFYPFYEFGKEVIYGIKPLVFSYALSKSMEFFGDVTIAVATLGDYKKPVKRPYLTDMRYGFEVKIGKINSDKEFIRLGTLDASKDKVDEIPVDVDMNDPQQAKLNDWTFLERRTKKFELPKLLNDATVGAYYVRVGNGGFNIIDEHYCQHTLDNYNWKDPVEIYVVVFGEKIYKDDYEGQNADWRRVPATLTLYNNTEDNEIVGPKYPSTFHYLGKMKRESRFAWRYFPYSFADEFEKNTTTTHSEFDSFRQFFSDKKIVDRYTKSIHLTQMTLDDYFYLYVAKVNLDYSAPKGNRQYGLRPFAKKLVENGYYEYAIRPIQSAGKSGLNFSDVKRNVQEEYPHSVKEFTLRVKAPKDHFANVPWAENLNKEEIRNWIEQQSTERYAGGRSHVVSGYDRTSANSGLTNNKSKYDPKKLYASKQTGAEKGAVIATPAQITAMDNHAVIPPDKPADWPDSYDIGEKPSQLNTFADTPKADVLPEGTKLVRYVGEDNNPQGSFWVLKDQAPQTEEAWRSGSAVKNSWNGDGAYVEYEVPKGGLKVWRGAAAAQPSDAEGYMLKGGAEQIWMPSNTVPKMEAQPTPWNPNYK